MAYVYRHIRLDKNIPFYIGIGGDTEGRHKRAFDKTVSRSLHWKSVADKGYEVEILMDGLTWEDACEKEKEFIKLYGRKDLGLGSLVNQTDGGDGVLGIIQSYETKEKRRQSLRGRVGSWTGKTFTKEHREKIGKAGVGRKHSHESRRKVGEAQKGNNHSGKGAIEVYRNGKMVFKYKNTSECAKELNLNTGHISGCLIGKRRHHKGYTFKRIEK